MNDVLRRACPSVESLDHYACAAATILNAQCVRRFGKVSIRRPAYNQSMSKSLLGRALGTLLLVATVGLSTCQGGFNASLPGATITTPSLESRPSPQSDHG